MFTKMLSQLSARTVAVMYETFMINRLMPSGQQSDFGKYRIPSSDAIEVSVETVCHNIIN